MPKIDGDSPNATYTNNLECPITKISFEFRADREQGTTPLEMLTFSKTEGDNLPLTTLMLSTDVPCLNPKRFNIKDKKSYPLEYSILY